MKQFFFLLLGFPLICFTAKAQSEKNLQIIQDPRLEEIINKRIEYNKKLAESPQGFRILIYSGNQRQDAYDAQNKFKRAYPDLEAYLGYAFPNFKVMAGDFKSKDDATEVATDLEKIFQGSALLVVPEKIDLSKAYVSGGE